MDARNRNRLRPHRLQPARLLLAQLRRTATVSGLRHPCQRVVQAHGVPPEEDRAFAVSELTRNYLR